MARRNINFRLKLHAAIRMASECPWVKKNSIDEDFRRSLHHLRVKITPSLQTVWENALYFPQAHLVSHALEKVSL